MNVYELFEPLNEKWSEKYKRSINCSNPKGFSQRAHCAGRKKNEATGDANFDSMMDRIVKVDPYIRQAVYSQASMLCDFYKCEPEQMTPKMLKRIADTVGIDIDTVAFMLGIRKPGRVKENSWDTHQYQASANTGNIPEKMIHTGYVVTFDPATKQVTISKAGKVYSQFTFKGTQSFSNYKKYVERAIEIINNKVYGVNENIQKPDVTKAFVKKFLPWLQRELNIKQLPKIELLDKPMTTSFGSYDSENNCLYVVTAGRHPVDVLRTLAHELTHHKQNQAGILDSHSGATGTDEENEANANAGIVMRDFAKQNPHYFGLDK